MAETKKTKALFRDLPDQMSGTLQRFYEQILSDVRASTRLGDFASISIGSGLYALRADKDGIWLGAEKFVNAPFSVDMEGNVTLNSIANIVGVDTTDQVNAKISISKELIEAAVAATYATHTDVAALQLTADALNLSIGRVGGSNMLKNSVGLKGTLTEWQIFDTSNALVDARNNAAIDKTEDVTHNTESGSAYVIANQYITQTIDSIIGTVYGFRCRFHRTTTLTLSITGIDDSSITVDSYISGAWATYTISFTATTTATTIRVENTSGTATISDLIVKPGEVSGWTQAPNESYGQNYRLDKDGLRVSDSNSTVVSQLDENGLTVADIALGDIGSGDEIIMMKVTKDSGKINNLVAQTGLTVQRYENPSSSLRMIPVTDGIAFVIND